MRIKRLTLYTDQLEAEKSFYVSTLGLKLIEDEVSHFTIQVGWSELVFKRSTAKHTYHYCFLIPSNKLLEAVDWIASKTEVLNIDNGRRTQCFESWNADSFYFHDASGNIAECIARHDLDNQDSNPFSVDQILCVNEIGLPTADVARTSKQLSDVIGSSFWKGDLERFGTNGDQEALFLLPNYLIKDTWFPTSYAINPEPFEAQVEHRGKIFELRFMDEVITSNN